MTPQPYLDGLVRRCADEMGARLAAVWVAGSLVMGDFYRQSSDLDVILVAAGTLDARTKDGLAKALSHTFFPCPVHGLDLILYTLDEVETPKRAPCYEFALATGAAWKDEVSGGGRYAGGLLDLSVVRALGQTLFGVSPQQTVGEIPVTWLVEELAESLRWHRQYVHDPFHDPTGSNAVLNACRAHFFVKERAWVSKTAGARWVLDQGESRPVVRQALENRQQGVDHRLDRKAVIAYLEELLETFASMTS